MQFTYTGSDERVFPSISVVVQPGETFEAPEDFSAANVSSKPTKSKPTVGDE